jgi:molecular chaperone DnaK
MRLAWYAWRVGQRAPILGIDLGTTNTCAAVVMSRGVRMVPSNQGSFILPSVVALSSRGEILLGSAAKDQALVNPRNTITGAKRLIGRQYASRVVQELRSHLSYEIVPGPQGEAAVQLGDRVFTLPQISSLVLAKVKQVAEEFVGEAIGQAVISVPAHYGDRQRGAVKEAGELAGFKVKRIVNEPTAAALAYGFNRKLDQKILVYDLGGGTFDVSVLAVHGNVFEVLASGGDTFLGGADFDNRIVTYALERFYEERQVDLRENPEALQRIQGAAEAAKIDLTLLPNVMLQLPFIEELKGRQLDLQIPLSRDRLEALTRDLVDRTFVICDEVLASRNLGPKDIAEVILVGGQSRMPRVQAKILEHFGRPPRKGVHPDECVAYGAALLASSLETRDGLTLLDALTIPIGIATDGGVFRPILERNLTIPCARSFRLPGPAEPGGEIVIAIFQGNSRFAVENEYLGTLRIDGALAGRGIDFRLTEECLLLVSVDDPDTGPSPVELATRDTPASLKEALAADDERRQSDSARVEPIATTRRIWQI